MGDEVKSGDIQRASAKLIEKLQTAAVVEETPQTPNVAPLLPKSSHPTAPKDLDSASSPDHSSEWTMVEMSHTQEDPCQNGWHAYCARS